MGTAELSQRTAVNVQEKANLIWAIADKLVGTYKPHEYGNVILPMCVIKRFSDTLAGTKDKVIEMNKTLDARNITVKDGFLRQVSGYQFYNVSPFTFEGLLSDAENIADNFRSYLNHFSTNVIDVIEKFEFDKEITKLSNNGILYNVIAEFCSKKAYMGADEISAIDMGYIFEELVRKFSESYDEHAGAHFTARDIIYLMAEILVAPKKNDLKDEGITASMYDMAMGTSQMLDCLSEKLLLIDEDAQLTEFGQELNEQTYAIAKANMLIKGGDAENMKLGNTLSDDKFSGYKFDYIISNPPFGIEWKKEKKAVEAEHKKGALGRFGAGLPAINDSQQLFVLNGISKLKDTGRMAIIQDGSPFFKGDAESGESNIRGYIIENDWLEAIISLPTNMFYNTPLQTFIWIISKSKTTNRKGKVQLINAENCYKKRIRPLGKKRFEFDNDCISLIVQSYNEFDTRKYTLDELEVESIICDNTDFKYTKVVVETPIYTSEGKIVLKGSKPQADSSKRDYEYIPWDTDIEEYMRTNVYPYTPDVWIDVNKSKVGYEIPFTKTFYTYSLPIGSNDIAKAIVNHNSPRVEIYQTKKEHCPTPLVVSNSNWETARLRKWLRERREKVSDRDFKPLSVTKKGIVSQLEYVVKTAANDDRKLVRRGDFVINSRSDRKGASGIASEDGSVSLINIVMEPINVSHLYIENLLRSFVFIEEFYKMGHGIASDVWTTKYSDMKNMFISLPPIEQQRRISAYLETFSAEIDMLITTCEVLLEKLQSFAHFAEFDISNISNYEDYLRNIYEQIYKFECKIFGAEQVCLRSCCLKTKDDLISYINQCEYLLSLYKGYKISTINEVLTGKRDIE